MPLLQNPFACLSSTFLPAAALRWPSRPHRLLLTAGLLAATLAAPVRAQDAASAATEAPVAPQAAPPASPQTPAPRPTATTPQIVFDVLLGEIALKRDKPQVALAAYADLVLKSNDPEIFRRTLEVAVLNRQPGLMLETAKLWVQHEPDSVEALNALVGVQLLFSQYADAQPTLTHYLDVLPADERPKALLGLPPRFPEQTDVKQARLLVNLVTEPYLSLSEAWLARAQMAERANDQDGALEAVTQARHLQPASETAVLIQAQIINRRDPAAVPPLLAEYLAQYPQTANVRVLYAQLIAPSNLPEARAQIAQVTAQTDVAPEVLFRASAVAIQLQTPQAAIQALNRLQSVPNIDLGRIRFNLGIAYELQAELEQAQGQQAEADRSAAQAITQYEQVPRGEQLVPARLRAANLMAERGNVDGAREVLRNTDAADDDSRARLIIAEATLLRGQGNDKASKAQKLAAFKFLERGVARYPNQIALRYEMGMQAELLGQFSLFERTMREIIKRDSNYAMAYNALGYTYTDRNIRLPEARKLLEKALALAPNDPFILDSVGWLHYREKDFGTALNFLNRAGALRADPEIVAHQVIVLRALGRHRDAVDLWKRGIQRFPDSAELKALEKSLISSESAPPPQSL